MAHEVTPAEYWEQSITLSDQFWAPKGNAKSTGPTDRSYLQAETAPNPCDSPDVTLVYEDDLQLSRRTRWYWQHRVQILWQDKWRIWKKEKSEGKGNFSFTKYVTKLVTEKITEYITEYDDSLKTLTKKTRA